MGKMQKARALNIAGTAEKMAEDITTPGKEKWAKGFGKGTSNWQYWQEILYPGTQAIRSDPDLSPEQKMLANKAFIHLFVEEFEDFRLRCVQQGKVFAKRFIPVAVRSPRSSSSHIV